MLAKIFTEHEFDVVMEYVRTTDVITDRSLVYVWTAMDLEVTTSRDFVFSDVGRILFLSGPSPKISRRIVSIY